MVKRESHEEKVEMRHFGKGKGWRFCFHGSKTFFGVLLILVWPVYIYITKAFPPFRGILAVLVGLCFLCVFIIFQKRHK